MRISTNDEPLKSVGGNKKGEGCICLHLFTTGNITRHFLAVVYCVCLIMLR
jgi:hypothetical protein